MASSLVQCSELQAALDDFLHLCTFWPVTLTCTKTLNHCYLCWWQLAVKRCCFLALSYVCFAICTKAEVHAYVLATTVTTVIFDKHRPFNYM